VVVVAGIVPSCNVGSSIHRAHPPCDACKSVFTILKLWIM
jgi:hypothetical protein